MPPSVCNPAVKINAQCIIIITSLQNDWGFTPLMGASMTGQADIAKLLLEHKANIDCQDKEVSSTLHTYNMSDAPVVVLS